VVHRVWEEKLEWEQQRKQHIGHEKIDEPGCRQGKAPNLSENVAKKLGHDPFLVGLLRTSSGFGGGSDSEAPLRLGGRGVVAEGQPRQSGLNEESGLVELTETGVPEPAGAKYPKAQSITV